MKEDKNVIARSENDEATPNEGVASPSARNDSLPELPEGWVWTKIGEIANQVNPGFPSGKHNKEGKGIPHLRPMNINIKGEIDLSEVKYVQPNSYDRLLKGDVLFNNTNSPDLLGKTTYIIEDTNWAYSNHMTRIRLIEGFINHVWISYSLHNLFLSGFYKMNCTHHVNQASINRTFLTERVFIPLPPLPEQNRIVAKMEELFTKLDAGVEALKKVKAQLKRYRQAVLKYAFEGKLTEGWRETHKNELEPASVLLERIREERKKNTKGLNVGATGRSPLPVDTSDLAKLPEGWVWTTTSNVCSFVTDGTHDTPKYVEEGTPLITSKNLKEDEINFTTARNISIEDHKKISIRSGVKKGDVLFAMIGTIGNPVVVQTERIFSIKNVALFKENGSFINSEYLKFWLASWIFNKILENRNFLKGTTQKFIPLEYLRIIPIPLPPLPEQHKIVEEIERRFSVADKIEKVVEGSLKQSERLRQSILKKAFEGKLVPQNAIDEPAEKLLERIKLEKNRGRN